MKTKQLLLTMLFVIQSCTTWEDELSKKRVSYSGNEFKINGCYYRTNLDGNCSYLFFYSNGILLWLNDRCDITSKDGFKPILSNLRSYWSIFKVERKVITETEWVEANLFSMSTNDRMYNIENDTTLSFINQYNDTLFYHFKRFNPKPDSTNVFIK